MNCRWSSLISYLKGGHYLDKLDKAGTALLVAELMMEGTKNKTPLELEEEIERLGANISISASATRHYHQREYTHQDLRQIAGPCGRNAP